MCVFGGERGGGWQGGGGYIVFRSFCLSVCYILVTEEVWGVSNRHCLLTFLVVFFLHENIIIDTD